LFGSRIIYFSLAAGYKPHTEKIKETKPTLKIANAKFSVNYF